MKKFIWFIISFLMVLSLVLASCGEKTTDGTTKTDEGDDKVVITETTTGGETEQEREEAVDSNVPQYGGTIVLTTGTNWQDFDEVIGSPITFNHPMRFTSQEVWIGDWSKGPAGTGDTRGWSRPMLYKTGDLAESWNFDGWDAGKLIFNIRKGVHWALDPDSEASRLVNGREVTAEDVAFSFNQVCKTTTSYIYRAYPVLREANIYAADKYTFVVEAAPPTSLWFLRVTDFFHVVPHEVVEKYGNMSDWENLVGSGPFMLKDLIDNSSVTFEKNSTYWATNTAEGPGFGDQLPYVDKVRVLIIADTNTRQSAFRTGNIDNLAANWQDGPTFIKALPDIKYRENPAYGSPGNTAMRTDLEPFNDIRVRKAMFKALDFKKIAEALYGQGARWLSWPIGYSEDFLDAYLDVTDPDCPGEVKDIYTYDPEAAKQLLADAGYPSGIKGNCIVLNNVDTMDLYQTLQSYWAQVGIDITLDPREQGAWYVILQQRNYDFLMYGTGSPITNLHQAASMWGESATNPAYINDPKVNEAREQMMALSVKDDQAADKIFRELMKYVLAQAWVIPHPGGVSYSLWWPWLKNYYGPISVGYMNTDNWVTWAWVDTELKRSMGY
ncbi:MAG TPA: ABC transporter substrate-binding protein [Dehalococcoidia bacterium]|nr:ABC transporter substrate-binding protein [Dehalococcoidia bacterium]